MTDEQQEQIIRMSYVARTNHYLKLLISKEITKEEYDEALEFVFGLPYCPLVTQDGDLVTDTRESMETVASEGGPDLVPSGGGCGETQYDSGEEESLSPDEWADTFTLPLGADGQELTAKMEQILRDISSG